MGSTAERLYYASPVWLQNLLVSAYGYRLYRKRYTGIYHEILELIRESRSWTTHRTEQFQSEQLFNMARYCRHHIPYYQTLFAEYGLHENDFTSTGDLRRLPVLDKQTLREQSERFQPPGGKPYMVQHTSGSTGTPLALVVNEYTYKLAMALVVEHEEFHGVPFGARRATFAGRMVQPSDNMQPPFARMNRAENQQLFSSYHLNANTFPWYRRELDRFQPLELIGYPSAICDLAAHYQQVGATPQFRPNAIVTNSETLLAWQRDTIESVFGCPVFDYYGTAEYVLFASQGHGGEYQLNPVIGITELIPDEPAGSNRLIATSLTNYSMPLLRYDTGDTGDSTSRQPGTTIVRTLSSINGRVDDYIETPDGRRIGRIDHIFKGTKGIREAQVVQENIDHCTINVIPADFDMGIDKELLRKNLLARTGPNMEISVKTVSDIPRGPNGKFKAVLRQPIQN